MRQLSSRGHLIGFGVIWIALTWFASVAVYGWLNVPDWALTKLVVLSILWLFCAALSIPLFLSMVLLRLRLRRIRRDGAQRQAEIQRDYESRKVQMLKEHAEQRKARTLAQQKPLDEAEEARARREYFRR